MKITSLRERGQALILIALAAIGLFAITGLAIDGSAKFSDRRHAQNAADTAALTGALALVRGETNQVSVNAQQWQVRAIQRADENGYDRNHITNEVWVYKCSENPTNINSLRHGSPVGCGEAYEGKSNYVQVVIVSHVNTYFARVIGINQTHNTVQAVALAKEEVTGSLLGGNAIVELKPKGRTNCSSGNGEFEVAGSGMVNIYGGGVLVNSNSACAFQQNGCNTELHLYNGGQINLVGGPSLQLSCPNMMPPQPWPTAEPIEWPPTDYELPPPPECGQSHPSPIFDGVNTTTIKPGYYSILPPNGLSGSIVHMEPGTYCVSSVLKAVGNNSTLEGTDIFIYIEPGGEFDLRGGQVTLEANTTNVNSIYKGYLIYVAPDPGYTDFSVSPSACIINGSAVSKLTGGILAPYCDITISGSSGSTGIKSQIIGYTITLSGSNTLNFYYDAALNPEKTVPAKMGLIH